MKYGKKIDMPDPPKKPCTACGGSKTHTEIHPSGDPKKSKTIPCPWCNGEGVR